jgi:hypothetical protein
VPRYTDAHILEELAACAERLGRSPTMREFSGDPEVRVHPQTVVERFGTWNRAKRQARLVPRRFATADELLAQLTALGRELGRTPTGRDLDERRAALPSKSLYWYRFGSLTNALRAAGFDVPGRDERAERALAEGETLARTLGRLPRFSDWQRAHWRSQAMLSEWQVYRLFAEGEGGWSAYLGALCERLGRTGVDVGPDGRLNLSGRRRSKKGASTRSAA